MNIAEVKKRAVFIKLICISEQLKGIIWSHSEEIKVFIICALLTMAKISEVRLLGVAFGCAFGMSFPWAYLGCIAISLFLENGFFTILATLICGFVMHLSKKIEVGEGLGIALSAAASSLGVLGQGFLPFVVSLLATPIFALGFTGLTSKKKAVFAPLADGGFLCLAFGLALAFSHLKVGVLSFGIIAAVVFSIEGSERRGYLMGSLAGFFSGCAIDLQLGLPLAIGGFVCGIVIRKYRVYGLLVFLTFSDFTILFLQDVRGGLEYAVSSLWGAVFWIAISCLFYDKKRAKLPVTSMVQRGESGKYFSVALCNISSMLSAVSKSKRKEREEKIKMVVDGVFAAECETCSGCGISTVRIKEKVCNTLERNKRISEKELPCAFREQCARCNIITEKLNALMEKDPVKQGIRMDTLAEDYMSLSRLLAMGEKNWERRLYRDIEISRKIKLSLELANIRVSKVETVGERLPTVEIWGIPFRIPFPEKAIKTKVEKALSRSVELVLMENEGKTARMKFRTICPRKVDCYKISIPKAGEIVCGDTNVVFETDDGYFYSILSDGMGSGRDAAVCSRLGAVFLEKLISAGIQKAGAVSMLGNIIAAAEDEVFTTIDLAEIDLVRGKLSIIKAGAAPSWILRQNRAYSISSGTLPCGIIAGASAEQTIMGCESGDIIVQASDGGEEVVAKALEDIIKSKKFLSSKEIATILTNAAVEKNKRNDDISFCVMSVL